MTYLNNSNTVASAKSPEIDWSFRSLGDLSVTEFYQLLRLRIDVFVVEQTCAYAELDDDDASAQTLHVQGRLKQSGQLIACARVIESATQAVSAEADEAREAEVVKVGRVVVARQWRGCGVARELMQEVLGYIEENCQQKPPGPQVHLSAQTYVSGFYRDLGFKVVSGEYLEDGIPHVDMVLDSVLNSQNI